MLGLSSQIVANGRQTARADRVDRIPLRPPQAILRRRVSFLSRDRGAATLQTLQQPTQDSRWMDSDEQMHMSPDHPDLQDSGTLLCGDRAQEAAQEPSHPCIDQRPAITGLPDNVTIDTIDHARNLNRVGPRNSIFLTRCAALSTPHVTTRSIRLSSVTEMRAFRPAQSRVNSGPADQEGDPCPRSRE